MRLRMEIMSSIESASSHRPPCRECGAYEGHYMHCSHNNLSFPSILVSEEDKRRKELNEKPDSSSTVSGSDSVADHPADGAAHAETTTVHPVHTGCELRGEGRTLPTEQDTVKNLSGSGGTGERKPKTQVSQSSCAHPLPTQLREIGGKLVRDTWIAWAKEQPNVKPSWLVPWEELSEPDKEVDRRIWEACQPKVTTETREIAEKCVSKLRLFRTVDGSEHSDAIKEVTRALQEATEQAWKEHDDVVEALGNFSETIKQLGKANAQLRQQAERDNSEIARLMAELIVTKELLERCHYELRVVGHESLASEVRAAIDQRAKKP